MNEEEREKRLLSLLATRRSEAFWAAQRARIMAAPGKYSRGRAWLLAPVAAAALIALFFARVPDREPEEMMPSVSVAFIEHLDMLDDMDILEAIGEDEL